MNQRQRTERVFCPGMYSHQRWGQSRCGKQLMLPQSWKQWSCTKTTWQSFTSPLTGSISREINLALMSDAIPFDHLSPVVIFLFLLFFFTRKKQHQPLSVCPLRGQWLGRDRGRQRRTVPQASRQTDSPRLCQVLGSRQGDASPLLSPLPPCPVPVLAVTGRQRWKASFQERDRTPAVRLAPRHTLAQTDGRRGGAWNKERV